MSHQNALSLITFKEDKEFLLAQREKERREAMAGVDLVLAKNEVRAKKRKFAEEEPEQRPYHQALITPPLLTHQKLKM